MNTLLIYYVTGPLGFLGQEQQRIINYLQGSGTWAKISETLWLIKTTRTTVGVRDDLRIIFNNSLTGNQSKIIVINVSKTTWASYNFSNEITDWMKDNI